MSVTTLKATDWIAAPSVPPVSTVTHIQLFRSPMFGMSTVFTAVTPAVSEQSERVQAPFAPTVPNVCLIQNEICLYAEKSVDAPSALYAASPVVNPAAITSLHDP